MIVMKMESGRLLPVLFLIHSFFFLQPCLARIHHLTLNSDGRRFVSVDTFGFYEGGKMKVKVELAYKNVSATPKNNIELGFTITRTMSASVTPYVENRPENCLLHALGDDDNINIISFLLDVNNKVVRLNCSQQLSSLEIKNEPKWKPPPPPLVDANQRHRRSIGLVTSDTYLLLRRRRSEDSADQKANSDQGEAPKQPVVPDQAGDANAKAGDGGGDKQDTAVVKDDTKKENLPEVPVEIDIDAEQKGRCTLQTLPLIVNSTDHVTSVGFQFVININRKSEEGLYTLYFHNCISRSFSKPNYAINMTMSISEDNNGNFLSAGEMPLPHLFFGLSLAFFAVGCIWICVLRKKKSETFKVHYLMGLLVFVKSFSLLFHGMNYHFIAVYGYHIAAWAVLYYITHLLKGALLFITIVLIGTGWAFVKHILSDKDKKIFMIVIPLQVLANVAEIITEESEQGESQHAAWRQVFILVDLLCCGAILFPVVWSIRHLQEASHTDGKAAINLQKLKLFRHFYVMIVCYIYFTRIIVYLLKITVPFQYEWLDEFFRQGATLLFFVFTGYKFQPASSNPYFQLSQEDDELEMEEVITQTGVTENITKTVRAREFSEDNVAQRKESSHEYD